jgi:hypothetical protein
MMDRFALCFHDERRPEYIEHEVATLVGQRVFGIELGYEDLNDHDELRRDPMMAILAGKLAARREDCAPVAGKSTVEPVGAEQACADALSQDQPQSGDDQESSCHLFVGRMSANRARSFSISMRPMIRCTASRRGGSSTLLRLLLLPAALRVLRPSSAGRQAAERGD